MKGSREGGTEESMKRQKKGMGTEGERPRGRRWCENGMRKERRGRGGWRANLGGSAEGMGMKGGRIKSNGWGTERKGRRDE